MERSISRDESKTSWCTSAPLVAQTCETLLSKCEIPIIDLAHMGEYSVFEPFPRVIYRVARSFHRNCENHA